MMICYFMANYGRSKGFIVGQSYSVARLKSVYGCGDTPFIHVKNGVVQCVCLRPDTQKAIPSEVWVPDGRPLTSAMTAIGKKLSFPLFEKTGIDEWTYRGKFFPASLVKEGKRLATAKESIPEAAAVLLLKPDESPVDESQD